ncbi:MAG: hypothetical protein H3C50_10415 [Kiritimatiellae bacterium]|nr:hypothetical protein [Kiritimatiellia bacterium]
MKPVSLDRPIPGFILALLAQFFDQRAAQRGITLPSQGCVTRQPSPIHTK